MDVSKAYKIIIDWLKSQKQEAECQSERWKERKNYLENEINTLEQTREKDYRLRRINGKGNPET